MTDQALDILKLVLLGLLYLFFARVLWAVWSEVRRTSSRAVVPTMNADEHDATTVAAPSGGRSRKPPKGRAGRVARLVIIEPKADRGQTFALNGEITIGRDPSSTIVITDDTFVSGHHAASSMPMGSRWSRTSARPTARSTTATACSPGLPTAPSWRPRAGRLHGLGGAVVAELRWGATTDSGRIRPGNEDNVLADDTRSSRSPMGWAGIAPVRWRARWRWTCCGRG